LLKCIVIVKTCYDIKVTIGQKTVSNNEATPLILSFSIMPMKMKSLVGMINCI